MTQVTLTQIAVSGVQGQAFTLSASVNEPVDPEFVTSSEVAGNYRDDTGSYGFVTTNGSTVKITPTASTTSSLVVGIDATGKIVGNYTDATGDHGFIYSNGVVTTIGDPTHGDGFDVGAVNANGVIAGQLFSPSGFDAGAAIYTTTAGLTVLPLPAGVAAAQVTGVDGAGEAFGTFNDSQGEHGFVSDGSNLIQIDSPATSFINVDTASGGHAAGDTGTDDPTTETFTENAFYATYTPGSGTSAAAQVTVNLIKPTPGTTSSHFVGMDAAGDVVGTFSDPAQSGPNATIGSIFVEQGGQTITLTPGGDRFANLFGVSAAGDVYGTFRDPQNFSDQKIFKYNIASQTYSTYPIPTNAFLFSTNFDPQSGEILGNYFDTSDGDHGFSFLNGTFTTIDPSATTTDTEPVASDPDGDVVGTYQNDTGQHGFLDQNGTVTALSIPGTALPEIDAINANGDFAGSYRDDNGGHAFVDRNGVLSAITLPASRSVQVVGIDAAGDVAGNVGNNGFIDQGGTVTQISIPGAFSTFVSGIESTGAVVGTYLASSNSGPPTSHGFIYQNGAVTQLDAALQSTNSSVDGVDGAGDIFGSYTDSQGDLKSFVDRQGAITTTAGPAGAQFALANGLDASGEIVGTYRDQNFTQHAFIAKNDGSFVDASASLAPSSTQSFFIGTDATGRAVGNYIDSNGNSHAFIYNNGTATALDVAQSTSMTAEGVDAAGDIYGSYRDATGLTHGFVDQNGSIRTIDAAGSDGVDVNGVDAAGDVIGSYDDNGAPHSFVGFNATNGNSGSGSGTSGGGSTGSGDGSAGSGGGSTGSGGISTGSGDGSTGIGSISTGSGDGSTGSGSISTGSGGSSTSSGGGSPGSGSGSIGSGGDVTGSTGGSGGDTGSGGNSNGSPTGDTGGGTVPTGSTDSGTTAPGGNATDSTSTTPTLGTLDATSQLIEQLYYTLLGRSADPTGLASFDAHYNARPTNKTLRLLAADLMDSKEYHHLHRAQTDQQFVDALYEGALGRPVEASALHHTIQALHNGLSRQALAVSVAESPEAVTHLAGNAV